MAIKTISLYVVFMITFIYQYALVLFKYKKNM